MPFKGYEAKCFIQRVEFGDRPYVIKFWSKYTHRNTDFWVFEERDNDYYHRGWIGYFYYSKDTLNILDEIIFAERKVFIPHNVESFLVQLYGTDWKTPKKMKKPFDYCNFKKELI